MTTTEGSGAARTAAGSEERAGGKEQTGGGIKAAAAALKKARTKGPQGAKGHVWKPQWMSGRPWLRTVPDRTQDEWESHGDEAPDSMYCICCVHFAFGHKDVLTRKVKDGVRSDKLPAHCNAAHDRAVLRWEEKFGPLQPPEDKAPEPAPAPSGVEFVEPALANLVRTCITTALTKSAIRLIPTFVRLQRANGTEILCLSTNNSDAGVHQLLHAAAAILRREQDQRLISAGMLSTMGDGSNDRKNTEQVPCVSTLLSA